MPLELRVGDLFDATNLPALAHGCNCAGSMAKGIAVDFRRRWPEMFAAYRTECKEGRFKPGDVFVWRVPDKTIFNLGTQPLPRRSARLEYIEGALRMPPLACVLDRAGLETSPGGHARLRDSPPTAHDQGDQASPSDPRPLADYYFVLGVPPDATEAELHAAWRRQLKYWHPDRGNHPDALEHAKLLNLAHDVLTDSAKRAAYDRQRAAAGWRPSASAPTYSRPTRWRTVSREGPPPAPDGFDRHGFVSRLEALMKRGRLMIEKRKDLASASKWEAQTQALLRDELGDHPYTRRFEEALTQPRPESLRLAYGILWAAYEDALKGDLKPTPKDR